MPGRSDWGRRRGLSRRGRRKRGSGRESVRAKVLREFRGAWEPVDLEQNVSKAGDLLTDILKSLHLNEGLEESRLREAWNSVAGDFIAKQTEPLSLQKGVLTLRVLQPSMRFHLDQSRAQLLSRLRRQLGPGTIREVRLTIG